MIVIFINVMAISMLVPLQCFTLSFSIISYCWCKITAHALKSVDILIFLYKVAALVASFIIDVLTSTTLVTILLVGFVGLS